jgi:outer membrane protein assembly factor BamD (BamD/ComL family)
MAAQMELERNNPDATFALLLKSSNYNSGDVTQRNKTFLQLAELSYGKKNYRLAYNFYDSLDLSDPALIDVDAITSRKDMLGRLAISAEIIERQDSLQHIASMPEDERKEFVRKLVRQLRKQQGLKDEGVSSPFTSTPTNPPLLFGGEAKGEWYFYNASIRSRGANEFKSKWGNRPNVDNWRRISVVGNVSNIAGNIKGDPKNQGNNQTGSDEITFDALYDKLPLTQELVKESNDSVQNAMFDLGKIYIQEIEDCTAGTETYENLRQRFPQFDKMDEVLFNLYYCYRKNGETAKAEQVKKLLSEKYPQSNFTTIAVTGKNPQSSLANPDATKTYEEIYDLFVEGKFDEAVTQKKIADAKYGKNYWTPQLLYIEAVYYIKQREDSSAINSLNSIVSQFPNTPLAGKATNLINVLRRRDQIEEELRNLVINRPKEESKAQADCTGFGCMGAKHGHPKLLTPRLPPRH